MMRYIHVGLFALIPVAPVVAQDPLPALLAASLDARSTVAEAARVQRDADGVVLGTLHHAGPFKDVFYGNLLRSFRFAFAPETDVLARGRLVAELDKVYETERFPAMRDTRRPWTPRPDWCDGYRHLLPRGPRPSRNETTYLYRTIIVRRDCEKTLRVYAEDMVAAWLNGQKLGEAVRNYGPNRYPVPLVVTMPLKTGENRLLIKATSMFGTHGFACAVDGVTLSNTLLPLHVSPALIGHKGRTNFNTAYKPLATGDRPLHLPGAPETKPDCVKEIAAMLAIAAATVSDHVGDSDTAAVCDTWRRIRDLTEAVQRLRAFRFEVEMTPMFDPPASEMAEQLGKLPTSPAATERAGRLAALEPVVAGAVRAFDNADPAAGQKVAAASAALDRFWHKDVQSLSSVAFVRCPPFGVNAIAPYASGGAVPASLCLVDPRRPENPPRVLLAEEGLRLYDMNISYDAKTLFFSARRAGVGGGWQIYEIGLDGSGLKQITQGSGNSISPLLLPDGRLMYVSDCAGTYVQCQGAKTGLLYTMERDGSGVRKVSANIDSDHSPQIMNDGRVLFTRWDYGIEKNVFARHALWTMNPDGTGFQLFAGNTIEDPEGFWEARAIPGRPEVICVFGPHHSYHAGMMGLVWNRLGPEAPRGSGFRFITSEVPVYCDRTLPYGYQDAFPVHERLFLMSYGGDGGQKNRLYLLDDFGNKQCLYEGQGNLGCWLPIEVKPRPVPPVIPSRCDNPEWTFRDPEEMNQDPDTGTATMLVQDVHLGLAPHVKRGQAKWLQVMEQVQKSRRMAGGEAWGHSPIIGRGTTHVRRLIGLVPVEKDGSAHFKVPALRSVSFNLLDAQGKTLMRMGSDLHAMPGEQQSCVGCHEIRAGISAPLSDTVPIAASKPPATPVQPNWGTEGILDYQTVIQPVWDRHCVSCHGGPKPDGDLDLSGDRTRFFCVSYDNLVERDFVNFDAVYAGGHDENDPLTLGAIVSPLCRYIDTKQHYDVDVPLEDRMKVYAWIDANVPYYGTYDYNKMRGIGARDSWETGMGRNTNGWLVGKALPVFEKRCFACHRREINNQGLWGYLGGPMTQMVTVSSKVWTDRGATAHVFPQRYPMSARIGPEYRINLTNPSNSALLQAPLSREAGGWGLCRGKDGGGVFANKSDPDYMELLTAVEIGKLRLYASPRVDMNQDHVTKVCPSVLPKETLAKHWPPLAGLPVLKPMQLSKGLKVTTKSFAGASNLARNATATSPDAVAVEGNPKFVFVAAAIDGKLDTYWDDRDHAKEYRLALTFKQATRVKTIRITGWSHHNFAPRTFSILGDGKEVGSVRNAHYRKNVLAIEFPEIECKTLTLIISAAYGGSPGIRELDVFGPSVPVAALGK